MHIRSAGTGASQSAQMQSLLRIVPGFNLKSIGRRLPNPYVPDFQPLVSLFRWLPSSISVFNCWGCPCSGQKSFGALFWEWSRQYSYSRAEPISGTARCGAECRKSLRYRERVSPMQSSLLAFPMGFGRSSGARLQSLVISWSTRFSGVVAYGLQVIFVSGNIRTIGKPHCCRRALGESRKTRLTKSIEFRPDRG